MGVTQIILLTAGGIIFLLSFLIPAGKEKRKGQSEASFDREEIRKMVSRETQVAVSRINEQIEEAVAGAVEKAERGIERLSNEKIMAINEYSDTVLSEMHKNHDEAMFLYDMLNSKHTNIKNTVREVNRTVQEAKEQVDAFRELPPQSPPKREEPEPPMTGLARAAAHGDGTPAPKAAFVRLAEEQMARELGPEQTQAQVQAQAQVRTQEPERQDKPEENNYNQQILKLYGQGKDRVQIARELGLGVGEVKLVLDLFEENA